jgi:hypothetical protein
MRRGLEIATRFAETNKKHKNIKIEKNTIKNII